MNPTRRKIIKGAVIAASMAPFAKSPFLSSFNSQDDTELEVHIFSKHLQFLDFKETGEAAAEMGFDGVDLTVRPKGHIPPKNVKDLLPKAVMDIEKSGIVCKMITTRIESVDRPLDQMIIKTAADLGIKYYRPNWFKYLPKYTMSESLEIYQDQVTALAEFNKQYDIIGCYQNHAGTNIGASFWEIKKIIEKADPEYFGVQYDIRHATVEGGKSWINGLQLLHKNIKTIVLKDFKWTNVGGKWKLQNTPIGEGMVDFDQFFKLLKKYQLRPPVSLHLEYPLGGAEKGHGKITVKKSLVFEAMKKDLNAIQHLWQNA